MTLLQIIVLAIVQGLTEFLPISSSGHLVLAPELFGWPDQGLAFDVAVHFGTLAGVVTYFYRDLLALAQGFFKTRPGQPLTPEGRLAWLLVLATIPVGIVGLAAHDWIEANLRSTVVIAATTAGFGLLLLLADRWGRRITALDQLGVRGALLIGCAQVLALVPGTSRSGITITAALAMGYTRQAAARFSFLMSVPVIVLATGVETLNLIQSGDALQMGNLALGIVVSGVVAYFTIGFFMRFVDRIGMAPFAWYRFALAGLLLYVLL